MLHGPGLQGQAFIPAHYHSPQSRCLHVQPRSAGRVYQPSARRAARFSDDMTIARLRHSSFTTLANSGAQFHSRSQTQCPGDLCSRALLQASINNPRVETKSHHSKLFVIDARCIIAQAYNKVSTDLSPIDEPQLLCSCVSALVNFLRAYTQSCPVAVVLPNLIELTQLTSKPTYRKQSKRPRAHTAPSTYFIPTLEKAYRAIGVAVYADNSHECRDIVGSLVGKQRDFGIPVVIVSSDTDFLQLLEGTHVTIMKPGSDTKFENISEQLFIDTMHRLHARQYVDVVALIGKKGKFRRIPGMKDELATLLISRFGAVEELIAAAKTVLKPQNGPYGRRASEFQESEMPEFLSFRTARNLLRHEKDLLRTKRLISINQKHYSRVRLKDLQRQHVRRSNLVSILQKFEHWNEKQASRQRLRTEYRVQEEERLDTQHRPALQVISAGDKRHLRPVAVKEASSVDSSEHRKTDSSIIDTRRSDEDVDDILSTTGSSLGLLPVFRRDHKGRILTGIAVGGQQQRAAYIDLSSPGYMPKSLTDVFQSNAVDKHGVFLREMYKYLLTEHGITMNGTLFDARIALDLLNIEEQDMHDLAVVTTGFRESILRDLLSSRTSSIPEYSPERAVSLCCVLTPVISCLRDKLDQEGLLPLALRVEFPLIRVLGSMEMKGVPVDHSELANLRTKYTERLSNIEKEITDLLAVHASKSANRKPALGKVFDARLTGHSATNSAYKNVAKSTAPRCALERMTSDITLPSDYRILANLFVQHEDLSKFIEREIDPLSRHLQNDGRIRTTFVQGSSATGRLATRHPNLQNIPVRSQLGRELRDTFRADDGNHLLRADYSQIELRIVASLCGDPFMLDAFSSGVDIHRCIAGKIFDMPTADVTTVQRKHAKQVVYSILYGVSSMGLSERLGVPQREAENLLSEFKIEFPAVQELARQLVEEASKTGYAKTLLGRRLPLPMLTRGDASERRAASRKAINMPIQGTQADMIKLSMVRIHERLRANSATSALVLQVHDELILEVTDSELEEVVSLVEEEMTSALPLTGVDVVVQIRYGPSWSTSFQPFSRC